MTSNTQSIPSESESGGHEHDRAVLIALCVTSFMAALNFFATSPFLPVIADDLGTSVPLLGQAATLMILTSTVLGLLVGPLSDRYGFSRPLSIGVLAVAATLIGISLSPSVPFVFLFSLVGGLADALVFGLAFAVAGTWFQGEARTQAIGWTAGSLSIAPVLGVPILTLIGDQTSWRAALFVGGVAAALAAGFVWNRLPRIAPDVERSMKLRDIVASYRPVLRDQTVMTLYLINLLRGLTWFAFVVYMGAYLEDRLHLGTREIGLVYMLSGLGYAFGGFSTRPRLPGSLATGMAISSAVAAIGVAVMILGERTWLLLLILPVSSFIASRGGIANTTLLAESRQANVGTVMVLSGSVLNLAAASGALIGGILIGTGGYAAFGMVIPLFAIAAAVIAFRFARMPATV